VIRQKFFSLLNKMQDKQELNDQQLIIKLYKSLHKVLLNLSNITRNKMPQEMLVKTAFELDETYNDAESIGEAITAVKGFMAWLKELPLTKQTQQIIENLDQLLVDFESKNAAEMIARTVFISYNHKDEATAQLLKTKLEEAQLNVILDSASMKAGTEIKDFITTSIENSKATISIVSNNSLLSGWVGIETVNALNFKDYFKGKEFVACCLDEDFTKDNYVKEASAKFKKRLEEIAVVIEQRSNENDSRDLNDEKSRLIMLDKSLDGIIGKLKGMLRIDISGDNLHKNFQMILDAIKGN
jgi:ribosomal protein L7Ae-like RNA K-turn-binding protein